MVGRLTSILLASVAAAPGEEKEKLLEAIDAVLSGMAYAGGGPLLLRHRLGRVRADGRGCRRAGRGKARNAVFMAVVGLVVVLLAKAIAAAISGRLGPILPGP